MTESRRRLKSTSESERPLFYSVSLVTIAVLALYCLAVIKADMVGNVLVHPLLWAYITFVTAFHLSRIPCALIYEYAMARELKAESHVVEEPQIYEPTVTFVIPCKNEEAAILNTLMECYAADYPKDKLEVIVINDGSTDNTLRVLLEAKARFPSLVIVDWKVNRGKRHGMAEGFRLAKGEIVVQLDSDSYLDRGSLREMVKPFVDPSVGAVCAHAEPANAAKNLLTRMQAAFYFRAFRMLKAAESAFSMVLCCSGCSSAYRRSVVVPIIDQFLAESFLGLPVTWGDDRSLTNWMMRLGFKTLYTHRARAWTIVPDSLKGFMKQQVRWKKGWLINTLFACRFVHKKNPFVAATYFYPLIIANFLAPVIMLKVLFTFTFHFSLALFAVYSLSMFLIGTLFVAYYRWLNPKNRYWPYLYVWGFFASLVLSWVIVYAVFTIQNRKWGTR